MDDLSDVLFLLLTLLVGSLFGLAAIKIKMPAGLMVGAIVGVAALNIIFDIAVVNINKRLQRRNVNYEKD